VSWALRRLNWSFFLEKVSILETAGTALDTDITFGLLWETASFMGVDWVE
jgi:hypothetical protein